MRHLIAVALLALTVGTIAASSAQAYTCYQNCNTFGGYTSCTTNCY